MSAIKSSLRFYTFDFKLKVIDYAERHSNREAARVHNVDERCVRKWKNQKDFCANQ